MKKLRDFRELVFWSVIGLPLILAVIAVAGFIGSAIEAAKSIRKGYRIRGIASLVT